jgi:hypothetical protein
MLGAAAVALASAGPPAPVITSAPANPTNSTTAKFAFSDSQARVTFACSLDASTPSACTSPVTYKSLAPGTHTFSVQARDSSGNASSATSYTWLIDLAPPTIIVAFPASGGFYNAAAWAGGCTVGAGTCGAISDPSGVRSVSVSVQQNATGKYWSGSGFTMKSETYNAATLAQPSATSTTWFYALPLPSPDGQYTVHVIATDVLGNSTAKSSPASTAFAIKTSLPPAPVITSAPPNPSSSTSAQFTFTDSAAGVMFQCQLDGAAFSSCTSGVSYSGLSAGSHTFAVRAVDAAGNDSQPASYTWQISTVSAMPFGISGNLPAVLYPGAPAQSIPVTLTNPNSVPVYVTALTVSVHSSATGCDAQTNFQVTQSTISSNQPVQVPAGGSVTLTGDIEPSIEMLDTNTSQAACEGAQLTLSYTGSAHS